ncbi:hypothetical protein LVX13_35645 [Streptomyces albulus]|uniref:hypothetical protein n=1 Tax=Streptomyces noursei TaxID=1971 RepID=UPI001F3AA417|nr:hypothetical protein [Streptomyces noursei]MCE4948396.1 hypothetical protein [Streptomyces noursei]
MGASRDYVDAHYPHDIFVVALALALALARSCTAALVMLLARPLAAPVVDRLRADSLRTLLSSPAQFDQ